MITSHVFVESPVLSGRGRLFRGPNELFFIVFTSIKRSLLRRRTILVQQVALRVALSVPWHSSFGPRRGKNRWRSICRGIDISLSDYLHFLE